MLPAGLLLLVRAGLCIVPTFPALPWTGAVGDELPVGCGLQRARRSAMPSGVVPFLGTRGISVVETNWARSSQEDGLGTWPVRRSLS